MQTHLLIDAVVRQTMVLIAQLSSSAGLRAPLAHLADEIFLNLSNELEGQGVPRKVVADMFGVALRSYQRKVQRLRESGTEKGRTLWQAVLEHLEKSPGETKAAILRHFSRDDPDAVSATLADLVRNGLAERKGAGAMANYAPSSSEAWSAQRKQQDEETLNSVVWLDISRHPGCTVAQIGKRLVLEPEVVDEAVLALRRQGNVVVSDEGELTADEMVIPVGSEVGWEAAVWDHYQTMVGAIATKLQNGVGSSDESVGGATLSFELPIGHPCEEEVLGLLARYRRETDELFERVNEETKKMGPTSEETRRVLFYFGQSVKGGEDA